MKANANTALLRVSVIARAVGMTGDDWHNSAKRFLPPELRPTGKDGKASVATEQEAIAVISAFRLAQAGLSPTMVREFIEANLAEIAAGKHVLMPDVAGTPGMVCSLPFGEDEAKLVEHFLTRLKQSGACIALDIHDVLGRIKALFANPPRATRALDQLSDFQRTAPRPANRASRGRRPV
jgi:hypothetical protein